MSLKILKILEDRYSKKKEPEIKKNTDIDLSNIEEAEFEIIEETPKLLLDDKKV